MREATYMRRKLEIERFNKFESARAGYKLGLNKFSDWTEEEYGRTSSRKKLTRADIKPNSPRAEAFLAEILARDVSIPDTVDWRQVAGRILPVQDQGQCGSDFSFSATGAMEAKQLNRTGTKTLVKLSEQNLMDCTKIDDGCWRGFSSSSCLIVVG